MKKIELPVHGITIVDSGDDWPTITSNLKENTMDVEDVEFNAAMDAIESIVLGHYSAGIGIEDLAYLEGLETAIDACCNKFS